MRSISAFWKLHKFTLLIAAVLVLGAFMRLYRISEYMTFLGDEGRDVLIVKRMIVDHKFTLLGPTASVGGFFMGPIYYYMMLPFLWLWRLDPTGPAVMVALLGVATIYLIYRFVTGIHSATAGILGALLYAVSPVVIAYSRSSWNPNVVPFFVMVLVFSLHGIARGRNVWAYFLAGVALGIGIQLHYLFLFLYVVTAAYLIVLYVRRSIMFNLNNVIILVAGIILGLSPFLAFEARHGFPNTISIFRFMTAGKDTGFSITNFLANVWDVAFRLFGRLVVRLPDRYMLESLSPSIRYAWIYSSVALLVAGVAYLSANLKRALEPGPIANGTKRTDNAAVFILLSLWFVVPLFLFGLYRKEIYDYYLGIMFPLPFIMTGMWLADIFRSRRSTAYLLSAALLLVNWEGRPMKFPPNNQLGQVRKISEVAFREAGGRPFNFALITTGNSDHAYRYFFEIWGNPPVTIENEAVDPSRRTVTDQLIVICETACQPLGNPLWEVAGFGRAEIEGQWDVPFVKIYRLVHYEETKRQ